MKVRYAMTASNLYDFNDVSDLPTELAERMKAKVGGTNPLVAKVLAIVTDAAAADLSVLTIRQIETIAFRMGVEFKSQQSLRTALNANVINGELVKPSRQSYSVAGDAAPVADVSEVVETGGTEIVPDAGTDADEVDPLAG